MEFDFTIDNTKECILETEKGLRNITNAVLRREYGPGWEHNPNIGWSKSKKKDLENALNNTRTKFSHEEHSMRFIDYSYILDLNR